MDFSNPWFQSRSQTQHPRLFLKFKQTTRPATASLSLLLKLGKFAKSFDLVTSVWQSEVRLLQSQKQKLKFLQFLAFLRQTLKKECNARMFWSKNVKLENWFKTFQSNSCSKMALFVFFVFRFVSSNHLNRVFSETEQICFIIITSILGIVQSLYFRFTHLSPRLSNLSLPPNDKNLSLYICYFILL